MSNWANEAGEPYMTYAELRFEAELDMQSAEERAYEAWNEDFYEDYPDTCPACGTDDPDVDHEDGRCVADDDDAGMEDSWLDGSYEE